MPPPRTRCRWRVQARCLRGPAAITHSPLSFHVEVYTLEFLSPRCSVRSCGQAGAWQAGACGTQGRCSAHAHQKEGAGLVRARADPTWVTMDRFPSSTDPQPGDSSSLRKWPTQKSSKGKLYHRAVCYRASPARASQPTQVEVGSLVCMLQPVMQPVLHANSLLQTRFCSGCTVLHVHACMHACKHAPGCGGR